MSMQIDHSKPLTDAEKKWLHEWSLDHEIETNERLHGQKKAHAAGERIDVNKALEGLVDVPPAPAQPISVAGVPVYSGPVVVEGENDVPPGPGEPSVVVPLPRDHPLTGVVDDSGADADEDEAPEKFDTRAARAECNELTVDELKDNLREFGEPVGGDKKELVDRLVKALKRAHDEGQ